MPPPDATHDESSRVANRTGELFAAENSLIWLLVAAGFAFRAWYAFRGHIDSDEPQHLHVAWAWAHHLLPYRDVFDNHMPLFQMLCAPLVSWYGESADLLIFMRMLMLPLYAAALWLVFILGRSLFSTRIGLWAAAWLAVLPLHRHTEVEFRPDNLWAVFWLMALAILLKPSLTTRRCFLAGIALGAAIAVSVKTIFLAGCLALACGGTLVLYRNHGPSRRRLLSCTAALLSGLIVLPLMFAAYFAARGAAAAFYYGVIQHNLVSGLVHVHQTRAGPGIWLMAAVLMSAAMVVSRGPDVPGRKARQTCVLLLGGVMIPMLHLWPIVTQQDYLPIYPLLVLAAAACTVGLADAWPWRTIPSVSLRAGSGLGSAMGLLALAAMIHKGPHGDHVMGRVKVWDDLIHLTEPGQMVMDMKGGLIFRPRAYYYVLETLTLLRIREGLMADDIPECMIRSDTLVAARDNYSRVPALENFINSNYVSVGSLMVAGKRLMAPDAVAQAAMPFDIVLPARYSAVSPGGLCHGMLDAAPCGSETYLAAGHHVYRPAPTETEITVVWAQAVERGFSPYPTPYQQHAGSPQPAAMKLADVTAPTRTPPGTGAGPGR